MLEVSRFNSSLGQRPLSEERESLQLRLSAVEVKRQLNVTNPTQRAYKLMATFPGVANSRLFRFEGMAVVHLVNDFYGKAVVSSIFSHYSSVVLIVYQFFHVTTVDCYLCL